jgi:hypothetical protein
MKRWSETVEEGLGGCGNLVLGKGLGCVRRRLVRETSEDPRSCDLSCQSEEGAEEVRKR